MFITVRSTGHVHVSVVLASTPLIAKAVHLCCFVRELQAHQLPGIAPATGKTEFNVGDADMTCQSVKAYSDHAVLHQVAS